MHRIALLPLLLLATGGLAASVATSAVQSQAIVARPLDATPQSRSEGNQAIDAAVAAALIGAISGEFGERRVEVKLDRVEVKLDRVDAGFVQREVRGNGRVAIGRGEDWIPIGFSALYDTVSSSVDHPALTLGDSGPGQPVAVDARLSRELAGEVDRRLGIEFPGQPVRLALDAVRLSPAGRHYLWLQANGIADFGAEGSTAAGVQGLYDPRSGEWLRVACELGASANRDGGQAMALR